MGRGERREEWRERGGRGGERGVEGEGYNEKYLKVMHLR